MDKHDGERIWELLSRHYKYTNSSRAKSIIETLGAVLAEVCEVMPVEYARALSELKRRRKQAMDDHRRQEERIVGKVTGFLNRRQERKRACR